VCRSQKSKKQSISQYLFALLGSVLEKSACKMIVKLTPDIILSIFLKAAF
jgi:hypothetical protein